MFFRSRAYWAVGLLSLAYVFSSSTALAQDEDRTTENSSSEEAEPTEESGSISKEILVTNQKGCAVVLSNAGALKVNQKMMLKLSTQLTGVAIIRQVNSDGTAQGMLSKKLCTKKFVGAKAQVMSSDGTSEDTSPTALSKGLPKGVEPESSAHNRIKKKFGLRAGVGLMFAPGATFAAGYNLSHKMNFEASYDSAGLNLLSIYKYTRKRFGILANYYMTNSLYALGGLVLENFSSGTIGGTTDSTGLVFVDNAFTAKISQIQSQFGIGNRWTAEGFIVGCEWVGFSFPLTNISEQFGRTEFITDESFESSKSANKKVADTFSLRLSNVYIGFAF